VQQPHGSILLLCFRTITVKQLANINIVEATPIERTNHVIATAEAINASQIVFQGASYEKSVEKKEYSLGALPFIMGVVFWAHGSKSNDAWFDGEQLTGEIITGIYIAFVGLACCACCCMGTIAANANNSEKNECSDDVSNASQFLEKKSQFKSLLFSDKKNNTENKVAVDDLESGESFHIL
jgi:hypothetical protein